MAKGSRWHKNIVKVVTTEENFLRPSAGYRVEIQFTTVICGVVLHLREAGESAELWEGNDGVTPDTSS